MGRCSYAIGLTRNVSPFPLQEPHVNRTFHVLTVYWRRSENRWGFTIQLAENCLIWNVLFQNSNSSSVLTSDTVKHIYSVCYLQELLSKELENSYMLQIREKQWQCGCHHVVKRLIFALDSLISESQYFSFFLLYALGNLSLFRNAHWRPSVRIMSAGLSQLLDLRLKTLRASSLFFSTPAIKITADSFKPPSRLWDICRTWPI